MSPPRILLYEPGPGGERVLAEAATAIASGAVVAHPTETVYGLAADPWSQVALTRLLAMKGRDAEKGFILIAASVAQVEELIEPGTPVAWRKLAEAFWPGPLTMILPPGSRAPRGILGPDGGIALRLSPDPVAHALVEAARMPLTSTSANRAGAPPSRTAAAVLSAFEEGPELILDGGAREGSAPSTLLDLLSGSPRVLREGPVTAQAILAALGQI